MQQSAPHTDEEVEAVFSEYADAILRETLVGLYRTKRALGLSVEQAYQYVLELHLGISK